MIEGISLEFALKYSGHDQNMLQTEIDSNCKLVYQITNDGKYCIGWNLKPFLLDGLNILLDLILKLLTKLSNNIFKHFQ